MLLSQRSFLSVALLLSTPLAFAQPGSLDRRAGLSTFCARFSQSCAQACGALTDSSDNSFKCAKSKSDFEFGCTCSDGPVLTTTALDKVSGLVVVKSKTSVTTKEKISTLQDTFTTTVTPVKTKSSVSTKTRFTTTKSTTVSAYQPPYFEGGDVNGRIAASSSSAFCSAFSTSCKAQCKSAKSTAKVNTCSRDSSGKSSDIYALTCTCADKSSLTQAALGEVGGSSVKPTTTSVYTVLSTKTAVQTVYKSTSTSFAPTTTTTKKSTKTKSTAATSTHTVDIHGPGRIRIDRTDRNITNDVLGYISTEILNNKVNTNADFPDGSVQLDVNPSFAASLSLQVDAQDATNVYAIQWNRGARDDPLYLSFQFETTPDDDYYSNVYEEISNDSTCLNVAMALWNSTAIPYAPATPTDMNEERFLQTYSFTLGASSLNKVNPSRKTQRQLRPFYYSSNATIYRPYAKYYTLNGLLVLTAYPDSYNCTRRPSGLEPVALHEVAYWFEPDPQ